MSEQTRKQSLRVAVDLEEQGHKYYTEQAEKADNPLAQSVLETLASQEIEHRNKVLRLADGHGLPEDFEDDSPDMESAVREVFESFSAEEREGWRTENTQVYEHAMELERKSYTLYEELAKLSSDDEEKAFFESLMQEESKHLESIENVYYFLSDPGVWRSVEESQRWSWMNM